MANLNVFVLISCRNKDLWKLKNLSFQEIKWQDAMNGWKCIKWKIFKWSGAHFFLQFSISLLILFSLEFVKVYQHNM